MKTVVRFFLLNLERLLIPSIKQTEFDLIKQQQKIIYTIVIRKS